MQALREESLAWRRNPLGLPHEAIRALAICAHYCMKTADCPSSVSIARDDGSLQWFYSETLCQRWLPLRPDWVLATFNRYPESFATFNALTEKLTDTPLSEVRKADDFIQQQCRNDDIEWSRCAPLESLGQFRGLSATWMTKTKSGDVVLMPLITWSILVWVISTEPRSEEHNRKQVEIAMESIRLLTTESLDQIQSGDRLSASVRTGHAVE